MGVYIYFNANPRQINHHKWEEAFADAAKIAKAGCLCTIVEREFEGHPYYAGIPSVPEDDDGVVGLTISGELKTGSTMEMHFIPQTFGVETPAPPLASMLAQYLHEPERYGLEEPEFAHILFNKTQGTAGHIWLLAMACVFCDRFPDATYLGGDITAGQVHRAVRLAEDALGRKLAPPVAYDMERLLPRVRELAHGDESMTARLFLEIYQGLRDDAINRFVAEHFTESVLFAVFRERAKDESIHAILKGWLLLDLPFRKVARMLVADKKGPRHKQEDFVRAVLNAKLHIEDTLRSVEGIV